MLPSYLADVNAAMAPGIFDAGAAAQGIVPPPPPDPNAPNMTPMAAGPPLPPTGAARHMDPSYLRDVLHALTSKGEGAKPGPDGGAKGELPPVDNGFLAQPGAFHSPAPIGPPASAAGPAPLPPARDGDPSGATAFPLTLAHGGGAVNVPAHETEMRGPTLLKAQDEANKTTELAIRDNAANLHEDSARGADLAASHAAELRGYQQQADFSAAEQQQEAQARVADIDATAKQIAQTRQDPNHFYASQSTYQRVNTTISLALGGFLQGVHGGSNPAMDMLNQAIDRDLRAQEFDYHAKMDGLAGKKTAYALAMQKYNDPNAARAVAKAAMIDAQNAEIQQQAAQAKGTEAANAANMLLAERSQLYADQIKQGVAFTPAHTVAVAPMWQDANGIPYDAASARGVAKDQRGEAHDLNKIGAETYGKAVLEGMKDKSADDKTARGQTVTLPNGENVRAPTDPEAAKARDLVASVHNSIQLANEAKQIRAKTMWRESPQERARLKQIQAELVLAVKDKNGLGQLTDSDTELAHSASADLFDYSGDVDGQLDRFVSHAQSGLSNRVKSYPGATSTAKGDAPKSFTPVGGK